MVLETLLYFRTRVDLFGLCDLRGQTLGIESSQSLARSLRRDDRISMDRLYRILRAYLKMPRLQEGMVCGDCHIF